jgi:hypothetical protein
MNKFSILNSERIFNFEAIEAVLLIFGERNVALKVNGQILSTTIIKPVFHSAVFFRAKKENKNVIGW